MRLVINIDLNADLLGVTEWLLIVQNIKLLQELLQISLSWKSSLGF